MISDHCPMLLIGEQQYKTNRCFRFEAFWFILQWLEQIVTTAWSKPVRGTDALRSLHIKLSRTASAIRRWSSETVGNLRLQFAVASEIILRLDQAQEERVLTQEELGFRKALKHRLLGSRWWNARECVSVRDRSGFGTGMPAPGSSTLRPVLGEGEISYQDSG